MYDTDTDTDTDVDTDTGVDIETSTDTDTDTAEFDSDSETDLGEADAILNAIETGDSNIDASEANPDSLLETIDLTDLGDQSIQFTVNRDAGFENSVGFYEVTEDGSVVDSLSGEEIAIGEAGYEDAAIANSLDFSLSSPTGQPTVFTEDLAGGAQYATYIIADGTIDQLLDADSGNDPAIHFGAASANPENFDYVRSLGDNTFGYEDLSGGGDADFNDLTVDFEFM